ncbi:hypothetical protein B0H14DRAFT_3585742 [Mycena olivaceomarginata]|nr:hypothetical protein B0H14DRAFT_3585742 [Mycena olivaceomarginata]
MNPPNQAQFQLQPPDPPHDDPTLTILRKCSKCPGALSDIRVHEGTTGVGKRGRVVQDCNLCHSTTKLTSASIYEDAQHLVIRIKACRLGHEIPYESLVAPLRFAPEPPAQPAAPGPITCSVHGCLTQGGQPQQASRQCIELKCKNCCSEAAAAAVQTGGYRDRCKAHNVAAASSAIPIRPPTSGSNTSNLLRPNFLMHNNLFNTLLHNLLSVKPAQPIAGPSRGNARGGNPRPLARPMSNTWVAQRFGPQDLADTGKVVRQKLTAIANHTAELVIFHMVNSVLNLCTTQCEANKQFFYQKGVAPLQLQVQVTSLLQMQLSAHPTLMDDLQINPMTWFDLWIRSDWKIVQASATFEIDRNHPSVIRLRPSLMSELPIEDCLGIDRFLSRKRIGTALVSPPKKKARTETISAPAQACDIIEIPDSPPLSASSVIPTVFYVIEHQEAWDYYQNVKDSGAKTSIEKLWPTLFPGSSYFHTTVTKWKSTFLAAPKDIIAHFAAFGRISAGSWAAFRVGCAAHVRGKPFTSHTSESKPVKSETVDVPFIPNPPLSSPPAPQPIPPPQLIPSITAEFGLCPFCDTPFTIVPSAKLADLHQKLLAASTSAPTAANPGHRTASLTSQSSAFCRQHNTDSKLLPSAHENNWPEHINYADISERMDKVSVMDTLQELLEDLEACESFAAATSGEFKRETAYFGELGYYAIALKIKSLLPATAITVEYSPLTYDALAEQVLIPEAMICLIMHELGISNEEAIDVLHDSTPFSLAYHSDISDRDRCVAHFRNSCEDAAPKTAPFPLPSPLLPPHALSPTLAPDNFEREPTPLSLISENLCHFCDEELPFAPSNTLIAMGKKLFELSWPDHMPDNPQHCRVPQIRMTVDYCARHHFKKDHIPVAIFGGWPFKPNFSRLFYRILDLGPTLRNLCKGLNQSHFFLGAIEYYGDKLTQQSSLKAQYASNRSSEHGAGYYGERGYQLLDIAIQFMFPDTEVLLKTFHPLTYDIAIREILIPETVTRLIQQDLGLGPEDTIAILKQSYTFGITLHPGDDDCEFYMAAMHSISRSHRRTEWLLRVWEAEGAALGLDFESWLRKQMNLEQGVKTEPVEQHILPRLPPPPPLGPRMVIDLTRDDE